MSTNTPLSSRNEKEPGKRRSPQAQVAANRAVSASLRPHIDRIGGWTTKATHLSAMSLAQALSPTEREAVAGRIKSLLSKVEKDYERFKNDTATLPRHGRIEDVRRSFDSLLSTLRRQV